MLVSLQSFRVAEVGTSDQRTADLGGGIGHPAVNLDSGKDCLL